MNDYLRGAAILLNELVNFTYVALHIEWTGIAAAQAVAAVVEHADVVPAVEVEPDPAAVHIGVRHQLVEPCVRAAEEHNTLAAVRVSRCRCGCTHH